MAGFSGFKAGGPAIGTISGGRAELWQFFFRSGSAREFSPEGALPVNKNDPRGDDVDNTCENFRNGSAGPGPVGENGWSAQMVSLGRGGVSARELSPEGALPVNENVPRGDDVLALLVVREISTRELTPEGALPVNEDDPRGDDIWAL